MCNLQTLAAKGLVRPTNTDGKAPHGAMRVWPIVAVPATTPNSHQAALVNVIKARDAWLNRKG